MTLPHQVRIIMENNGRLPIGLKQARIIIDQPGAAAKVHAINKSLIGKEYRRLVPLPITPEMTDLRDELVEAKQDPGSERLRRILTYGMLFLSTFKARSSHEQVSAEYVQALCYIAAATCHRKGSDWFGGPTGWKEHFLQAETVLRHARHIANAAIRSNIPIEEKNEIKALRPYLYLNLIVVMAERTKLGYGRSESSMKDLVLRSRSVDALWNIVQAYPHLWQACWNGLELSSLYHQDNHDYMLKFYRALVLLDPGYQDFDNYRSEAPTIKEEKGMKYFYDNYRSKFHISIARKLVKPLA